MRSSVWSFLNISSIYIYIYIKTIRQGRPNSHINLTDEMTAGNEIVPLEDIPNDQDGTDNRDGMAGTIDDNRNGMDEIDIIIKPTARPTTLNVRIQSEKKN